MPVHANDGPKGRMVQALAAGRPAVFVDDLPPHLMSAAKHAPDVGRLIPSAEAAAPNSDTAYAECRHPTHTLSRNRSLRSRALKPSPNGRGISMQASPHNRAV